MYGQLETRFLSMYEYYIGPDNHSIHITNLMELEKFTILNVDRKKIIQIVAAIIINTTKKSTLKICAGEKNCYDITYSAETRKSEHHEFATQTKILYPNTVIFEKCPISLSSKIKNSVPAEFVAGAISTAIQQNFATIIYSRKNEFGHTIEFF